MIGSDGTDGDAIKEVEEKVKYNSKTRWDLAGVASTIINLWFSIRVQSFSTTRWFELKYLLSFLEITSKMTCSFPFVFHSDTVFLFLPFSLRLLSFSWSPLSSCLSFS